MDEVVFVVEESPDGGFGARALDQSIFTKAATLQELHDKVREAVRGHFQEGEHPRIVRLLHVREEVIVL